MRNRRNRMFSKRITLEWWDHKQIKGAKHTFHALLCVEGVL